MPVHQPPLTTECVYKAALKKPAMEGDQDALWRADAANQSAGPTVSRPCTILKR